MHINNLIIGQGLAGTFLCRALQKTGQSCFVIDEPRPFAASRVASGVVNPVTGRRLVKTWLIDDLLPSMQLLYGELEQELDIRCLEQKDVIDFFPSPQMRLAFLDRLREDPRYLSVQKGAADWSLYLQFDFDYGTIQPCYLVNVQVLLQAFRKELLRNGTLWEAAFDTGQLRTEPDLIRYHDLTADRIIFCNGSTGAENPYFKNLPFAPNKGEVLIVDVPALPRTHILKKSLSLVPWKDGLFWAGSSHEWEFTHDQPTEQFRNKTVEQLKAFLKIPFTVVDHLASVRPATLERRPFVGFHPQHPSIGIFNGMGTKGCSLAPYFAHQFAQHIAYHEPLAPEVDIQRFKRVLGR